MRALRVVFVAVLAIVLGSSMDAQKPGERTHDLRSYGARGDGRTDDTAALQRGIDEVSGERGTLVVSAGVYVIGTVELRSHMTLQLGHGAVLQGSVRVEDYGSLAQYGLDHRYGINSSGEGDRVGMLIGRDLEDVRITGDGVIDGSGESFFDAAVAHVGADFDARSTRNPAAFLHDVQRTDDGPLEVRASGRPGTLVQFHRARNITVEGITLRNAPNWTLHLQHAEHVLVHGLRVENDVRLPNNDAFDCMDCHDLRVSDANLTAGDDDFAIVGSSDVAITNCTLRSNSAAIRFEDSSDAVFSNMVVYGNRGIAIFAHEGTHTRNALFQNIVMETRLKHGHWWGKAEPIYIASSITPVADAAGDGRAADGATDTMVPTFATANGLTNQASGGVVENIRFMDVLADSEAGVLMDATSPGAVRDITLRNVSLRMHAPPPDLAESEGGNFDLRWTAKTLADGIVKHDIPAVYARNIDTLTVDGLEVSWPMPMVHTAEPSTAVDPSKQSADMDDAFRRNPWPAYFSGALEAHGFRRVTLDRIHAAAAPASGAPVILLEDGEVASVRDSEATLDGQVLLRAVRMRTQVFTSGNRAGAHATRRRR